MEVRKTAKRKVGRGLEVRKEGGKCSADEEEVFL